jgi:hypothetical protein
MAPVTSATIVTNVEQSIRGILQLSPGESQILLERQSLESWQQQLALARQLLPREPGPVRKEVYAWLILFVVVMALMVVELWWFLD